ncbi:hypothetical protein ACQ859_25180 [Roseateles chitinivorans]|uniref:hypothetical protein n=1 Tax=Roseateles chitinivorans TaxID=2917965 RepID=UPI003D670048
MTDTNPYAPPGAIVTDTAAQASSNASRRQRVKTGRRLLVASIVGFIACAVMRRTGPGGLALLVGAATMAAAITGIVKVCRALELGFALTALAVVGLFVPFANIAVYGVLITRATQELRSPRSRTPWYQVDES